MGRIPESFPDPGFTENDPALTASELRKRIDALEAANRDLGLRLGEFRQAQATLESLNRTAEALVAERELEKIVQAVTDGGREISGAAFGAFFYNTQGDQGEAYMLYTLSGADRQAFADFPMPRKTAMFAQTFEGRGPLRFDDVTKRPEYGKLAPHHGMPSGHLSVRSYLAVPVISRSSEVLGGLFYGHPEPGMFDERAEKALVNLAAQAAVAVDNANLYTALQKELAQGKLREDAARKFAAIVQFSNDAIISKDLNSIITSWNPAAERIFGYTAEEMIGKSVTLLIPANHIDEEPDILRRIGRGETISHYETVRRRKDGTLIDISLTVSPLKDDQGKIVGASKIARDITDLKSTEEQLRQSQKMEAVGRLAGGIAHDFNNLLTAIIGFTDMARAESDPGTRLAEYLEEVRNSGNRAAALTQQLLAYSRKQILAPKVIVLNECVAEIEKMLRRLIGEDIAFNTHLEPRLGNVKADPAQIQQIIVNLALNARDAMPEGGILSIATANVYLDRDYVAGHPDALVGPHVMLCVSDTGVGMTPEVQSHIFEPFFTTKEVGKGTGLGLSSAYGIIKQSGGSIAVRSEPGKGSEFRLYFPLVDGKGKAIDEVPERGARAGNPVPQGETILLAEDESAVRKFLVATLQNHGYQVLEAKDGVQALELGRKLRSLDLLLTDAVMPNMNGGKLARELKALHPGLKTLFISGYAQDVLSAADTKLLDGAFLQKPFTQAALLSKLREALAAAVP
ncbi:MAG TPA: PAS domain S-box protein [Fibrobacteria bacterium]|nr:PAS domain S-box protein [Fibrobacteria bacterium]